MTNSDSRQQVRATYDETNDAWLVAVGRYEGPVGDDRLWSADFYVDDGYDGYHQGREAAETLAARESAERSLPLLVPYDTTGQV